MYFSYIQKIYKIKIKKLKNLSLSDFPPAQSPRNATRPCCLNDRRKMQAKDQ